MTDKITFKAKCGNNHALGEITCIPSDKKTGNGQFSKWIADKIDYSPNQLNAGAEEFRRINWHKEPHGMVYCAECKKNGNDYNIMCETGDFWGYDKLVPENHEEREKLESLGLKFS